MLFMICVQKAHMVTLMNVLALRQPHINQKRKEKSKRKQFRRKSKKSKKLNIPSGTITTTRKFEWKAQPAGYVGGVARLLQPRAKYSKFHQIATKMAADIQKRSFANRHRSTFRLFEVLIERGSLFSSDP
jgi:hypothetical protein